MGCGAAFEHIQIVQFTFLHSIQPDLIGFTFFAKEIGANESKLVAKFVFAVVAIASGLLAVAGKAVADDFVCNTSVADDADGDFFVFNDRF